LKITGTKRENLKISEASFVSYVSYVSYVSKIIYYKSIRLSNKYRKCREEELTILDTPIGEGANCKKDFIPDNRPRITTERDFWDNFTPDMALHKGILQLSKNQKDTLKALIIEVRTESELANIHGISQQAVNKTKRNALNILRNAIQQKGA